MAAITAEGVLDVLAEETSVPRAKLDDPAATLESLDIASLDVMSALFTLEDRFGVTVEAEDVEKAGTLGQFVEIVLAKAAAG